MNIDKLASGIAKLETLAAYQQGEAIRKLRELAFTYNSLAKLCDEFATAIEQRAPAISGAEVCK